MSSYQSKLAMLRGALITLSLMAAAGAAMAQSAVTLTASAANDAVLPDGQSVPMWGYACGAVSGTGVSCTAMNGSPQSTTAWQPPLIRVPAGQPLTITLINQLSFGTLDQNIPTSIVIDGQLGGGLGTGATFAASPVHAPQGTTWPGTLGGIDTSSPALFIDTPGSGYSSAPAVSFSGGPGSGAQGIAGISGPVSAVTVTNRGSGYSSVPSVGFAGTGSGAAGVAYLQLANVSVTSANGSYTGLATPTVTFAAPSCTPLNGSTCVRAVGTATMSSNNVNNANRRVTGVSLTCGACSRGAGYTSAPGVTFSTGPATATTTLRVGGVTVTAGGSNYTASPLVAIRGGGGNGATAAAVLNAQVVSVTVTDPGSGYTLPLTINFSGGGGSGASGHVTSLDAFASAGTATFTPPAQGLRVRSFATEVNVSDVGGIALTWNNLRAGTYLIHSGTHPSIQHAMGLYGVLVVTEALSSTAPAYGGTAYQTDFDADVPLLFSEIDPAQNAAVAAAVATAGFSETATWAGPGACKDGAAACYPPAVNYSPRYYLINGTSFDRANAVASPLLVPAPGATGNVLLRIVNAGQRLHVPAVVGADMTPLAEDGNPVSKATGVQSSIPMPPGKTFDATIRPTQTSAGTYDDATLPVYDRELSLSTNNQRDGGMQAYIKVANGAADGSVGSGASSVALSALNPTYFCVAGTTLAVAPASKGVLAGSVGASGVSAPTGSTGGLIVTDPGSNLTLNSDGTFTYTQASTATSCGGSFSYMVNGTQLHTATIAECDAGSSSAAGCSLASAPVASNFVVVSAVASRYASPPPGVLAHVTNTGLSLSLSAVADANVNADGSFVASGSGSSTGACPSDPLLAAQVPTGAGCVQVPYMVKDAQGQTSSAIAYVAFLPASNLAVNVMDGPTGQPVSDYRWIIEEDRTFWIDPQCQINSTDTSVRPSTCAPLPVESLGYNFHSANMPVIAAGCVGAVSCEAGQMVQGAGAVCDVGNGGCRPGASKTPVSPADVHLDPTKRYFISILPGDAINPTISGFGGTAQDCATYAPDAGDWALYNPVDGSSGNCGHEMGGAQIAPIGANLTPAITVNVQQIPLPTAKISVQVFEDDNPLNGENDAGGGVSVISPFEVGLGGFEIKLFDQAGQLGDNTGQITYDEFNEPVSNSLAGYIDPITHLDSCPITRRTDGLVGMVPTCPKYESDGVTPSPLAGQAVIANLYPGLYEVQAFPAADRIARGEQWLQTNTLDGGKPHEAFIKPNEPGYFQEFGPGGYHVSIGFANPAIINARKAGYCASALNPGGASTCNNTLTLDVTNNHMSRTPDQRTYDSESYDHYSWTQCYVSIGPADAEDFAFEPCVMTTDSSGRTHATATFANMPVGVFKMSVFDQWNDIMLDGLVGTVEVGQGTTTKTFPVTQWRTNLYTRTYIDTDRSGVSTDDKPGLALVNTNIRYRDGSIAFFNNTDLNGYAGFNEVFPFMNWLVVDTSQSRFKPTWTHVVYDAGGPVDCSQQATDLGMPCSTTAGNLANTAVRVPLPIDLRLPGAKYCDTADCLAGDGGSGASTGMLFPPQAFSNSIGWQGLLGQNTFMEFGVKPYKKADTTPAETGGIHGQVVYASTRPFDDPTLLLQLSWEPGIPHATVNLYSKTVDAQGNEILKLVDTTQTASWDDWAQGFRKAADGTTLVTAGAAADAGYVPNMNCPGQANDSPFFATLKNSKMWLDAKDPVTHGSTHSLAYQSQFKCYDGWSQLNQAQPAPYDGYYSFPSVTAIDPATGKPSGSNCHVSTVGEPWGCTSNPDSSDPIRSGTPMLPAGTYVVEVIPPSGYALVKEEDKNILMGDVYVAPVTQQFAGFGNIFILPDQAAVNTTYNGASPGNLNNTNSLGAQPRHEGDTGSVEAFWPCVGALRQVPDFNSEFPGAAQASPFAGAMRRLCDRKEVKLVDESSSLAKFYLYSDTHIAGHFTGTITNDFASEFDPFSPQFGEKFGPPNLPVGLRDFNGNQVARVYSDQWGIYNGLYFSTWSPNPPNPTGYAPQMSIACMNDPGPVSDGNGGMVTDPAYNPAYSNFCYEQPFMPGETTYMDTPVIPTQSFADGYNLPDTEFPDGTPAIKSVVNTDGQGPWVPLTSAGTSATVTFTVANVNRCQNGNNNCNNRSTITFPGGQVRCDTNNSPGPNCSNSGQNTRNSNVAAYIRSNISTLLGDGYTASGSNATVTISTPNHNTAANGTTVVSAVANVSLGTTPPIILAGGTNPVIGSPNLTITALGVKNVQNPHFAGPNATTPPYNQKTIKRIYSFGSSGMVELIGADGKSYPLANVSWGDTTITGDVPANLPACAMQQQGQYALCGQLVITRADNGKRSFDAITVTAGGSAPWLVTETAVTAPADKTVSDYGANFGRLNLVPNATNQSPLQVAIDSASPGDLILVQPGTYRENLIMWKPVRLQGVGSGSVIINADAHPAGHMDQWRRQVVCAFGLTLDGRPNLGNSQNAFDPTHTYTCPNAMYLKADRIPFEAITGWQASGNGNLAQLLQEPTLMGAYEGAGITVVGRGVREPNRSTDFWGDDPTAAGAFPAGAVYLSAGDCSGTSVDTRHVLETDYVTSNYHCNPSRIDGVSILNSSQGGGGVFVHGWAHHLEIANSRISANHATLAGAISLGNGETPPVYINDGTGCGPGSVPESLCPPTNGAATNAAIPFGFDTNVRIHHNMLWNNASIGDALFTGTPAGAGGVTVSAGGDNYQIDHNWIAGNLTTGDGGGIQSLGVSFGGKINNNVILFNQSTNPTLPTNGAGIAIQGANEPRTLNGAECGTTNDADCPPGEGDGVGDGLVIDGNLIYGNSAESGTGGGIALEQVNGSEVIAFPRSPDDWYKVAVTNNIIANNVAGYDGAGVSMRDALKVSLVNNTIVSNDTTASAGVLFKTLGAINASNPPPGCNSVTDPTLPQDPSCLGRDAPHGPQPSGLVTMAHTQNLNDAVAAIPGNGTRVTCPSGYGYTTGNGSSLNNADCMKFSRPKLVNNLFWQNRTFSVDIVGPGTDLQSQQNLVALSPPLVQATSGACPSGGRFWDIGLRTDDVQAGLLSAGANRLVITNSILSGSGDIGTAQETIASTTNRFGVTGGTVNLQICNGARMPPEHCADAGIDQNSPACKGFNAPPGASESTSTSTLFVFNGIQPTATVDEGHNWLNLSYGPLTLARPNVNVATPGEQMVAGPTTGTASGAYSIPLASPAVGGGTTSGAPAVDIYGNSRSGRNDAGAVQVSTAGLRAIVLPGSVSFGDVLYGTSGTAQTLTLTNYGAQISGVTIAVSAPFSRASGGTCSASTIGFNLPPNGSCTFSVNVAVPPSTATASTPYSGTVTIGNSSAATITNSPAALSATGVPPRNDLSITKDDGRTSLYRGDTTTYSIRVTNLGNTTINSAVVADTRPGAFSNWSWACAAFSGGTCGNGSSSGTSNINKTLGTLPPGSGVTLTVTAVVSNSAAAGPVANTATVTLPNGVTDVNTADNMVTDTDTVDVGTGTVAFTSATFGTLSGTTPRTLAFGNVGNGSSSTVTVSVSTAAVSFGAALFNAGNGSKFSLGTDNCSGQTVQAGQTCTVTVNFNGSGSTNRNGSLTLIDSGSNGPQVLNLNGS